MMDPSLPGGYLCPACGAAMTPSAPCPRCGRGPDAQSPRLVALDRELAGLAVRIQESRRQLGELDAEWRSKSSERYEIAQAMMAAVAAERAALRAPAQVAAPASVPASAAGPARVSGPSGAAANGEAAMPWSGANRGGTSDASPRTVQNLLFVLGGVLLGIGAIVFTVVAWSRYGIAGKMTILAAATTLALAIPLLSVRRGLRATAETFAAIGLLLVLLDGWGLYRLTHIDVSSTAYWATVLAVVAGFSAAYGPAVGIAGPRFVAVAAAQPVLPLIAAATHLNVAGAATAFAVTAALDLVFVATRPAALAPDPAVPAPDAPAPDVPAPGVPAPDVPAPDVPAPDVPAPDVPAPVAPAPVAPASAPGDAAPRPVAPARPVTVAAVVRGFAGFFGGVNLATASIVALRGMLAAETWIVRSSAGAFALCAVILFAATVRVRSSLPRALGVGAALLGVAVAGGRLLELAWPGHPIAVLTVITAIVVLIAYATRSRPALADGFRGAGWTIAGFLALAAAGGLVPALLLRLAAHPWWTVRLPLDTPSVAVDLTVAIAVAAGSALLLAGVRIRGRLALVAVLPVALGLGVTRGTPWWGPAVVDLIAVAAVLTVALVAARRERRAVAVVAAAVAVPLVLHAALIAQVRPQLSAATLGAVVVLCAALVALTARRDDPAMRLLASGGLAVGLVAVPPAIASAVGAYAHGATPPMRAALAAALVGLIAGAALRRREDLRGYVIVPITVVTIAVSLVPLFADSHERLNLYAMTGRLVIVLTVAAAGLRGAPARRATLPGDVLGLFAFGRIVPLLAIVAILPYGWLGRVWSGGPDGVGLTAGRAPWTLDRLDVLTAGLAAVSLAASGWAWFGRRGAYAFGLPALLAGVLVVLAVAGVAWPVAPGVALVGGIGLVLVAALLRTVDVPPGVVVPGLIFGGAGLSALLAAKASTLIGLAVTVIASALVAWAGRSVAWRVAGWVTAGLFGYLLVVAAIEAGDVGIAAYGVMALALVLSVFAPLLGRLGRERVEVRAIDAVSQAGAFAALVLSGTLARAAVCACAWGVLVGVRALWPDVPDLSRRVLLSAATGLELIAWWLVAADRGVGLVDAYTAPLAAVALFAGWQAARARPTLSSWAAYGPALFALFGPGVAPAIGNDPAVVRRLVIGGLALAVVLIGAQARLQAPVVVGAITLGLLALHELVLVWQALPAWIPLTAAGLLVIIVAATYERRRRDWRRIRAAIGRMS